MQLSLLLPLQFRNQLFRLLIGVFLTVDVFERAPPCRLQFEFSLLQDSLKVIIILSHFLKLSKDVAFFVLASSFELVDLIFGFGRLFLKQINFSLPIFRFFLEH